MITFSKVLYIAAGLAGLVDGCSNIIVSPGASADSSSMVAYNADSAALYGSLYHYPAADHPKNSMRDIYDWDTGVYLGQIEEVEHTYNVVGNMNEFGLSIGETTYGGVSELQSQPGAKIDYGSLIWVTLQRAKTAREAIHTISRLMSENGYASEGESFSIADPHEAWVMEIIGKGSYERGAVWVARRIPDGYVCAHANQARITTFPLDDPEDTLYAPDVISFARKIGLYDGPDEEFSFSDVYDAVTFSGARFCEARVWSFFGDVMGEEWAQQYLDYAQGYNLTNRMPLWVKPVQKVSLKDTMRHMRNHYENTPLAMDGEVFPDVGASYGYTPVRAHPLTWTSGSKEYLNERPIATQQTGWNFIAQSRKWMPQEFSGLLWFGVDDSATTVRFPVYGSATRVADAFAGAGAQDGVTPPLMKFDFQSAFSVFNLVANWAYSRWDLMYPDVLARIESLEDSLIAQANDVDIKAKQVLESSGVSAAIELVTSFSVDAGNSLVRSWANFFGEMFVKYKDGYVFTEDSSEPSCGCSVANGAYTQSWYDRIVADTGDHYLVHEDVDALKASAKRPGLMPVSKAQLLARR
eukprot:CAMPEP_0185024584 /NCGR_PEP_ID=MMETSP1103-20130426/7709_1 /TAXON_ID=36769 /ORGANISM="Paraphysomonas bandaiensis, Strain Caron Lab Isolate" /LENGTH=580 /DNA_ID=CAMNT_0027557599 /DNA_START=14 /DNA_END=1756 /DNA_ORIENTATION=+